MNQEIKAEIKACEEQLKQAMLESDISELDKLLGPDLIFTNHLGQVMTKQDDLEAHKSGMLKIKEITLSDNKIRIVGDIVIVSVQAKIVGVFAGEESENNFRFTRVWCKNTSNGWQIITGHSSIVV